MKKSFDRRSFLKISGSALGMGALYSVLPFGGAAEAAETMDFLGHKTGEKVTPFTFLQLSDSHVGFNGPPDPLGTKAFERAIGMVNALPRRPDLVLFTGDLTHDSDNKDVHSARMTQFKQLAAQMRAGKLYTVPGENDAGLDGGTLYREHFGETFYSFDHRGVHFVALDNVTRAKPEVGPEQIAWLQKDLARFPKTAPIVVFTHRPLFDLKPEWEWFTSDGDQVMNVLAPYDNVTVLYGHIHRDHAHEEGNTRHYAARSLIFAFPDPEKAPAKKPLPFDAQQPFKNLGIRTVEEKGGKHAPFAPPAVTDVELTLNEHSGLNGIQQFIKQGEYKS